MLCHMARKETAEEATWLIPPARSIFLPPFPLATWRTRSRRRPTDRATDRGDEADDKGKKTYHDSYNKERGSEQQE